MEYSALVDTYEQLEQTQSTLEKTSILAELYSQHSEELEKLVLLSMGRSFPEWKDLDLGLSSNMMVDIIQEATGRTEEEIENVWKNEGDLGNAAEQMVENKTQQRLMTQDLTVQKVRNKLEKVAKMQKEGLSQSVSQDKKKKEIADLISSATPREAKYLTRTVLRTMRLGVGEGIVRDALAEAFFDGENTEKIQRAYDLTNDFTKVAEACKDSVEALENLEMELFQPINSMLAKKVETVEEGFEEVGTPAAIDYKYDGMRAQIHIGEEDVKIFTRRLEDVTKQFPDVKKAVKEHVEEKNIVIDCEIVAYDPEDFSTVPFQKLSKRIKRKYDIQKLKKEIPVEVRPFDLLYRQESTIDQKYSDRWNQLNQIVDEEKKKLRIVDHEETEQTEDVQKMQQESLAKGHEGIMMKAVDKEYKPGSRVGYMVKLKPTMETLDLAVIAAKWGEGRRSDWLSRLRLGCWDKERQEYRMIGKLATGLTDEQLEEITEKLKPLITEEDGREVQVRPEIIIEAEYEEIQKSPNYDSGYALRFPRMKQFREDKEEADSLEKVENLYQQQN
ncbi:MAG: ATP-dependent DNA ligase [Candidatus Nanohaloarchaea archaeon]